MQESAEADTGRHRLAQEAAVATGGGCDRVRSVQPRNEALRRAKDLDAGRALFGYVRSESRLLERLLVDPADRELLRLVRHHRRKSRSRPADRRLRVKQRGRRWVSTRRSGSSSFRVTESVRGLRAGGRAGSRRASAYRRPIPGYGYESGNPYEAFLPPARRIESGVPEGDLRAVVFVVGTSKKGTVRSGQEYESPIPGAHRYRVRRDAVPGSARPALHGTARHEAAPDDGSLRA